MSARNDTPENVEKFTVDEPIEEVYRRIQNELDVQSWTKVRSNHTFGILTDDGHFSFEVVRSGIHSTLIFYRTDRTFTESGLEQLRSLFASKSGGSE